MSGTPMGRIKAKLGLKGPTKPGEMITAMNKAKVPQSAPKVKNAGIKSTIKKII